MSAPFDFRGKLTEETRIWLEHTSRRTGRDKQDIVREHLHKIAVAELHDANDLATYARQQGLLRADEGRPGQGVVGRRK